MTQYVAIQYTPGGRPYTYRNDGQPVSIGDRVRISTAKEGAKTVTVTDIVTEPAFATKPILGKAEEAVS